MSALNLACCRRGGQEHMRPCKLATTYLATSTVPLTRFSVFLHLRPQFPIRRRPQGRGGAFPARAPLCGPACRGSTPVQACSTRRDADLATLGQVVDQARQMQRSGALEVFGVLRPGRSRTDSRSFATVFATLFARNVNYVTKP